MLLRKALDAVITFSLKGFSALSDLLSPERIEECLADTGGVTVRKRRLPMQMMVWAVTGMAFFRSVSMDQLVSHFDIALPGKRPFVALEWPYADGGGRKAVENAGHAGKCRRSRSHG